MRQIEIVRRAIWLVVGTVFIAAGGLETACRDREAQPSSPPPSVQPPAAPPAEPSRAIAQTGGSEDCPTIAIPFNRVRPAQRYRRIAEEFDRLLDRLQLPPDATVLDIGAGPGEYAMRIAERLGGEGRVFATDIDPGVIQALREAAAKRGLTGSLMPVLVGRTGPHGVDEFYRRHSYDLILAVHLGRFVGNRTGYYKEIRPQLKGGGRLVIVQTMQPKSFLKQGAISDPTGLIEALAKEPDGSPFIEGLRPETKKLIETVASRDVGAVAEVIAADFLGMTRDLDFGHKFLTASGAYEPGPGFSEVEREQAAFLMDATKERFFGKVAWTDEVGAEIERNIRYEEDEIRTISPEILRMWHAINDARHLNTLLIFERFREFLFNGDVYRPVAKSYARLRQELRAAGYRLVEVLPLRTETAFVFGE